MRDDEPSGTQSVVRLDSAALRTALQQVTALGDRIDAQRLQVAAGTPLSLTALRDAGPAAQAAAWLHEQGPGLQDLLDLATLLETTGTSATYLGSGTFADARLRIPGEITNALEGLDPADPDSRTALVTMEDLLGRYADDPGIGAEIVEELGGTGLVHVFDSFSVSPPPDDSSPDQVHAWWAALTPTQQLAVSLLQSDKVGNRDGVAAWGRDIANRTQLPLVREQLERQFADATSGEHPYDPYGGGFYIEPAEAQELRDKIAGLDAVQQTLDLGGRQLLGDTRHGDVGEDYLRVARELTAMTGLWALLRDAPTLCPEELAAAWPGAADDRPARIAELDRARFRELLARAAASDGLVGAVVAASLAR